LIKSTIITDDYKTAAHSIMSGGIVVFPTETVYGIGASSLNLVSCQNIYKIKERPSDNPLIVHISCLDDILPYVYLSNEQVEIINQLIPGPVSFIVKKKKDLFSSGLNTIAFRIPDLPIANEFLRLAGPVSAPSANISGKPSITRLKYIVESFNGRVDCILRGEPSKYGIESTIISLIEKPYKLVRLGSSSFEKLQITLPDLQIEEYTDDVIPISPGLKYKHYSPVAKVNLVNLGEFLDSKDKFGYIGFNPPNCYFTKKIKNNMEYMYELYAFFIESDRLGLENIYCEMPKHGEFHNTLMNRILKAKS
jgi:L-threonylcarbamoyladenylate synthase